MIKFAFKVGQGGWCYPRSKRHFSSLVPKELKKSGQVYCRVSYGIDLYNHATLKTMSDVRKFLSECTEPELLRYFGQTI